MEAQQQKDDTRRLRALQEEGTFSHIAEENPDPDHEQTKIAIVVAVTCVVLVGLVLFARFFICGTDQDDEEAFPSKDDSSKVEKQHSKSGSNGDARRVCFAEP